MSSARDNGSGSARDEFVEIIHGALGYFSFLKETGLSALDLSEESAAMVTAWDQGFSGSLTVPDCLETILNDMKQRNMAHFMGQGPDNARLFLVMDAQDALNRRWAGIYSDEQGALLLKILKAMGLAADSVYAAPLGHDRSSDDRASHLNSLPIPAGPSLDFLKRQILVVDPVCICTLGEVSAAALLNRKEPLENLRGSFHDYNGIQVMPTFHPGLLLKDSSKKRDVWEDMKQVMKLMGL